MNTRAHIAQLIGHMHGLKPNQASPCLSGIGVGIDRNLPE